MTARKKTAKKAAKKAPAKKTNTRRGKTASKPAGATRPKFKASAATNRAMTDRKSLFFTFPVGTTTVRVIPRYDPEGLKNGALFVLQRLHYDLDGAFPDLTNEKRKIAPACLQEHGDGNCYMCNVNEWLKAHKDERLKDLGDELYASEQLQAQVWILDPSTKLWYGPRIAKIPKGVANDMTNLINVAEDNDMPAFCDPDSGMGVAVTRTGQGQFGTKYSAQVTGKAESMDDLDPDWWSKCFKDLHVKLDVKVCTIDQQKEMLCRAHPDLPWDDIEKDIG